jgi:hypothetical protein
MKRSISTERTYFLGDYKSLKIIDKVEDIPEELTMNPEFMEVFRHLQLMEIERAYYDYSVMSQVMRENKTDGERLVALTEVVNNTFEKLLELYKKTVKEE